MSERLTACAISTLQRLPQTQVLIDSFRKHHPDGVFDLLVVSDPADEVPTVRGATVLSLVDVFGAEEAHRLSTYYDTKPLMFAVKPPLLRYMLDRHGDHAVYFDGDMLIMRSMDELASLARTHSTVITPHAVTPVEYRDPNPNHATYSWYGLYNAGFIAVGDTPDGHAMLDWWAGHLRFDCVSDVRNGWFYDQKWLDFIPSYFPCHIQRHPGWNLAHWNLHERSLERDASGEYLVNGEPLYFAHFSAFDYGNPARFTTANWPEVPTYLDEHPALVELSTAYGRLLDEAGLPAALRLPPPSNELHGRRLTRAIRHRIREEYRRQSHGERAALPSDPTSDAARRAMSGWLSWPGRVRATARMLRRVARSSGRLLNGHVRDLLGN